MRNKAILVPAALLISSFAPWLVTPLLMLGGAYLCFEGTEKLAHRLLHSRAEDDAHRSELTQALANPELDVVQLERDKIKGAVRTDFILSAEIIAITLGIAVIMTLGVYGFVAAIVKLDDLGLWLNGRRGQLAPALGRGILAAAPWLMKALSVAGTLAMFLVGGGILVHGLPPLHHAVQAAVQNAGRLAQTLGPILADGLVGLLAGALVLAGVTILHRLRGKPQR